MKQDKKYIFVGNRACVLKKMLELNCKIVKIYAVKGSYLERFLQEEELKYEILPDKKTFCEILKVVDYDVLISNGCPHILPISKLQDGKKKFINIHPSLLPDLRGKSPINGALLFGRKHGVTCHYMGDVVDTGDIITQIEIPISSDLNLDLLYQISFLTEGIAFEEAFKKEYAIQEGHSNVKGIYYSRREEDMMLTNADTAEQIVNKVNSFSTKGQYAKIINQNKTYHVYEARIIHNEYVNKLFADKEDNILLLAYGMNEILLKMKRQLLCLKLDSLDGLVVEKNVID